MRQFLLLLFCSIFSPFLIAQTFPIKGNVKDSQNDEAIVGVNIVIEGTTTGTSTDKNGNFNLEAEANQVLIFSFIGYKTQFITIHSGFYIDVQLEPETYGLDGVVITALGIKSEERDIGYGIQSIKSKELTEVQAVNFVDNLSAKLAGITVSQGATGVGSTSKITIRGEASFTNNNPLFVVDGTIINNSSILNFTNEAAAGFQEVDFGNGAMDVNTDDIASVTVLKGPSGAALYGTRASNGVIIITTKNGGNSQGMGISVNSSFFIDQAFQLPEFQNSYGQGNSGQFEFVDGLGAGINDNITYSWGPKLDEGNFISQFDSPVTLANGRTVRGGDVAVHGGLPINPTLFKSNPDNLKDFYQTGFTASNNISVSSGFENGNFRVSATDLRSESIIPGVNLFRKTLASKLNFNPSTRLKISASINYINSQSDNRPSNGYGSENANYSLVAWGPRSLNTENLKDYWQPGLENLQQYSFNYTFFDNPYFILLENRNSFNRDRAFGNVSASYQFTEKLSLMLRSGMDFSSEKRQFRRSYSTNRFRNGAYAEHNVFFRENNTDFLLNYRDIISNFSYDISLGANRMDQNASTVQTQALSLAQPGIYNLSNAASPLEVFQRDAQKRINSMYGLIKLGYKNFLFLNISGRNDWSSALANPNSSDNVSFFYPSFAASYVLSNTMELPKYVSLVRLRASWAQVGNDTDPYQTSTSFVARTAFNSQPSFSSSDLIANSNLLPESTSSTEIGGVIHFFRHRLRFDFTYYDALTENQIISLPVAISSGYNEQVVNGGEVRSKGFELIMGITPVKTKNFQWKTQFNLSRNVTTVESLPAGIDRLTLAYSRVYDNVNQTIWFQVEEGGRVGDMYGTGYLKNENGGFIIDAQGKYIVDNSLKKLGNYNPDFILGFSNDFSYKNWSANFLFDWRQGGEIVSRTQALAGVAGQLKETENRPDAGIVAEGVVNVGSADNPVWQQNTTAVSAESYYRQYYDRNHEENNIYDASYLKLRQVSIGYTFPSIGDKGLLQKGRSLKIALVGRNLFAISAIPHFDPEQLAIQGNSFISGVEDMSYATSRSYGMKLSYNF